MTGLLGIAIHIKNAHDAFTHQLIPIIVPVPIPQKPTIADCPHA